MPNEELNLKIEDLFRWKGNVDIVDKNGEVVETLYQRVIGDAEVQKSRVEALKASRELRKSLRDPESDEALANLAFDGEFSKDELIALILMTKYIEFRSQAMLRIEEKAVKPLPSEATLEEQEQYITDLETARLERDALITEEVNRLSEKYAENLKTLSDKKLLEERNRELSDFLCRNKMMLVFDELSTFYGTFSDQKLKTRRFKTVEDLRNLAPQVKHQIVSNYKTLELGLDEVKK